MNLVPQSTYTIVRQIGNITDTNIYYVKAVVRNLNSGATLATIKLTNQGNQRFTAPYQVPADTSGLGTYISITTYVYDDSGYTVSDQNYATEDAEYLVIQPPVSTYGNGGTTIVDYDKIKKFISDIKFPGIPTYDKDFSEMRKYHDGRFDELKGYVEQSVKSIKIPEPTPYYNDGELRQTIAQLQNHILSIKTDHAAQIKNITETHTKTVGELNKRIDLMGNAISASLSEISLHNRESANEHSRILREGNSLKEKQRKAVKDLTIEEPSQPSNAIDVRVKKLLGL